VATPIKKRAMTAGPSCSRLPKTSMGRSSLPSRGSCCLPPPPPPPRDEALLLLLFGPLRLGSLGGNESIMAENGGCGANEKNRDQNKNENTKRSKRSRQAPPTGPHYRTYAGQEKRGEMVATKLGAGNERREAVVCETTGACLVVKWIETEMRP
jgi:hypothetical protein